MILVAIDPGKKGAISISTNGKNFEVYPMPETEKDLWEFFNDLKMRATVEGHRMMAYLEKVNAFGMGLTSAWTFSGNWHCLKMCLIGNKIPFDLVTPKSWQKEIGLFYTKGSNSTAKKKQGYSKAQELYPELSFKRDLADSLLILRYGKIVEKR